jgi:GT2 family glycosyltransferase
LSRNRTPFEKQNELIRTLRNQLEATERELADEKWVFEQFLQSPSWRLTYPIRWLAKQLRALKAWIIETGGPRSASATAQSLENRPALQPQALEIEQDKSAADLKEFFTSLYRIQLQSFLASNLPLRLPHSEKPEISVILVLYNRAELTLACLRSIAENYSERLEIIIVDNNSSDDTSLLLDRLHGAHIIRNKENLNFLLAVNQGAREAHGEYLLVLNNDTQLMPGALRSTLKTIRSSTDIGAVGGRLILLDGTLQEAGSIIWRDGSCLGYGRGDDPFAPTYMFQRDVDYCSGAFLLTPRNLWNQMGGFDETFKPAYYEETDYCMRLWNRGKRVVYDPNAVLLHYEFASSASVKSATDLQREHQAILVDHHREALSRHYPADLNWTLLARMKGNTKRILFIDDRVPHTWFGSGYPRARAILLGMIQQGFFVTFYPSWVLNEEWSTVYSDMPREVEFMMSYGFRLLEAFLRNRRGYYDTIFVSRPHNMGPLARILAAVPEWFEGVNIIYDAEALFFAREVGLNELRGTPLPQEEVEKMLREEVNVAAVADCVVSVSEAEKRAFERNGVERVRILGHSLSPEPLDRPFQQREGFLFVGAVHEEATPNGDSLVWFLEEVFPKIQEVLGTDATVTIAGFINSERIKQLATPSVRITGHLPDLTGLYAAARVFIAPTRYAAGIPHKVHEAAARGLPVVATPLLATQLGWQEGAQLLVGHDAESFARKCIELHKDEELWMKLRQAGLDRVRTECSKEVFDLGLKEILSTRAKARDYEVASASHKEF